MKPLSKLISFTVLGLALTTTVQAADLPGKGVIVRPVQSTVAEEMFQTVIVDKALQRLGYQIEPIKQVDYNVAYTAVANGDATFMAVNWDPLHATKYKRAGGDKAFYRRGYYITGAAQGYMIDKKTAEKYHITNIAQLKDPKLAKLFDSNGDGKADLTGCNPGWGCETVTNYQIKKFGLSDIVELNEGNYSAIIADTISRYRNGKPVLYYTWTPYWVSGVLVPGKDAIWLEVPFSAIPNDPKADTALPNGKNYGFRMNSMRIVANKAWAAKNPAAAKLFAIIKLSVNDVSAENLMMRKGQSSEEDIQRHAEGWINAHQALFDHWIDEAAKAATH
ncbi:glycine betaine/L-proline ABC transporter substrate-binding protein ProX [Celerinatantimonas sp. YJH-8]|uniref:glycine betaine/L-proline ABC transporter substrate-binding protein ProX n=1 Tax=Celerinatantimonas sp. YJH-8 TaxID=3228714 RepID=UPI0038BE8066